VIKILDDVVVKQLNHRGYVWYRQDMEQRLKYVNKMHVEQKRGHKKLYK
jgi:hypothetical protein